MPGYSSHSKMQICTLLLLLLFFSSCKEQNKTEIPKSDTGETQKTPAGQQEIIPPSEDPSFVISQDTISKHGPNSITRNLIQDKNGNFWIATWEGIIRYDSNLFTNVTLKEGLRHFHVFSLLEDRKGNLWFGTIGGGAYRYDGKSFTLFTTTNNLAGNTILCIIEDKAGNIWFGTDKGVSRYNGNTFNNFTTQEGLSSNFVSTIAQDKNGKLWFGTNSGVNIFDPSASIRTGDKSFTNFTNEKGLSFQNVRTIVEDKTGKIWIGSQEGLTCYDPSASQMTGKKSYSNFPTNLTNYIYEDKAGILWLSEGIANGSDMTLTKYDGNSFTNITTDKQVFGITRDINGNIWFGTANGVCRYDGNTFAKFSEH
jgi:ligand-binding sensor domain-containing protein